MAYTPVYRVQLVREGTILYRAGSPDAAVTILRELCIAERGDREVMAVCYLDGKNGVIGAEVIAIGGMHGCATAGREVFRGAILAGAAGIVLAHNHPSGDPTPSDDDYRMTQVLVDAGKTLGIHLCDHIVLTHDAHHSMLDHGDI